MPSPGRSSSNDIPQLSLDATRPLQPNTNLETSLSNTRLHSEEEHLDSTSLRSASEVASGSQSPRRDSSNNQSRQQTRLTERQRVKLGRRAGRVRATSNRPSSEKGSSPKRSKRELPRDTSDSSSGSKERSESWYRCSFTSQCKLQSPERKVVSHFFGRNKLCTRALPENLCVGYCRKHYQRTRYRNVSSFAILQLDLIKAQLDNIEQWGGAHDCEFTLRKRAMDAINVENAHQVACDAALRAGQKEPAPLEGPPCDARFLLSHLGKGKSFQQIRTIIAFIENHVKELQCPLPEFEILANIKDEFKPARKRAAK
ncbi:hypothetical protein MMC24_005004 [Lignoscripta atroalba]|nr:hypothetical protein [Lignoscripta atroalba]